MLGEHFSPGDDVIARLVRARDIVLGLGWNSTCYQILNPGISHWFSKKYEAMAGYVDWAGVRVVAGSPVARREELVEVVREFEADAAAHKLSVCYFASEARLEATLASQKNYRNLLLGAQPVWRPATLAERMQTKTSLRMQLRRSENKGVKVELWDADHAESNPELARVLSEWLSTRGLPSLHFLVEPSTLANLKDRKIFVASRGGEVIGFVNLSPVPVRNGWLVEQFVRGNGAPNGTIELMLFAAANELASIGSEYMTLGLSPLSHIDDWKSHASPLIKTLFLWARAHGRRFYNFTGLEFFKTKFEPEIWEPIYAIANPRASMIGSLYAIAAAFTNGHPIAAVLSGAAKALGQEVRWITRLAPSAAQDT